MELFEGLLGRRSASAKELGLPVPDEAQLERAVAAALTAPDHGAIKPWRFLVVQGEGLQRLAEVYADSVRRENPAASEEDLESARGKALRSPLLIVCAAKIMAKHPKVPPVEQIVAAGCGVQNLLTALHGMGFGAVLVTGPRAYDEGVKAALGFTAEDAIIGFVHVGTPTQPLKPRNRPVAAQHLKAWP